MTVRDSLRPSGAQVPVDSHISCPRRTGLARSWWWLLYRRVSCWLPFISGSAPRPLALSNKGVQVMRSSPRRRVHALVLTGCTVVLAAVLVSPPPALGADVACTVTYTTNDWDSGFTANVSLRNDGAPMNGWRVGWTFLDGQKVQQGWGATFAQPAAAVTATNMSYNGQLGTGASTSFGVNGSKGDTYRPQTDFSVN